MVNQLSLLFLFIGLVLSAGDQNYVLDESQFIIHTVDPSHCKMKFYWKDDSGKILGSIQALKEHLESKGESLRFATNGGMFQKDQSAQGLFIENGKIVQAIDRMEEGYGNFYLQPNGIFYITEEGKASVVATDKFRKTAQVAFATQSGPMLVVDGAYHPAIRKGSKNLHVRNAVGILASGEVMFAISKKEVNFYDLATLFKQRGCENALYLDGFVSKTYCPEQYWEHTDGPLGVLIGETY